MASNPWVVVASLLLGVLGIVISIFTYLRSKKVKVPLYVVRNTNLIRDVTSRYGDLAVTFNGVPIRNFTSTRVAIWNGGRETIDREDVAAGDPLRISVAAPSRILAAKVIHSTNDAMEFQVVPLKGHESISLSFNYVDLNEGAVVQVLHDGKGDEAEIAIEGRFRGAGQIKENVTPRFWGWLNVILRIGLVVYTLAALNFVVDGPYRWFISMPAVVVLFLLLALAARLAEEKTKQIPRQFRQYVVDDEAKEKKDDST